MFKFITKYFAKPAEPMFHLTMSSGNRMELISQMNDQVDQLELTIIKTMLEARRIDALQEQAKCDEQEVRAELWRLRKRQDQVKELIVAAKSYVEPSFMKRHSDGGAATYHSRVVDGDWTRDDGGSAF